MSIIDEELAQAFLEDPDDVDPLDLAEATEITDEAAEILSKHQGALYLQSLTKISNAAAESLSKHQGDLRFQRLTELSDAAAKALSKSQKGNLFLGIPFEAIRWE